MSNDQKQSQQPNPPKRDSIPVKLLRLSEKRTLPNGQISDVIMGDVTQLNRARFTIEYIPAMQHHRVCYFEPGGKEPKAVMMYPREWASWEPLPL